MYHAQYICAERMKGASFADDVFMELHAIERLMPESDPSYEINMDAVLQLEPETMFPGITPPGMAYVPYQIWHDVYSASEGLKQGTMFPDLDFPFLAAKEGRQA